MVSGNNHDMAAGRSGYAAQEAVIEFLRAIARTAGVENIARDHQDVYPLTEDGFRQPAQKSFEFIVALPTVQGAPDMPVRRVEDFHLTV